LGSVKSRERESSSGLNFLKILCLTCAGDCFDGFVFQKGGRSVNPIVNEINVGRSADGGAGEKARLKMIVPVGRQGRAMTFWASWFIDMAMSRRERLVVAEGDYIKPLLASRFEKIISLKDEMDQDPVSPLMTSTRCELR
jgi:hypothetical protein